MELIQASGRVDPIAISPAELATLVTTVGGDQASPLGERLRLPAVGGVGDPMVTHSMQSLVLRDLAQINGELIEVVPELQVVAHVLASPSQSLLVEPRGNEPRAPVRAVRSATATALISPLSLGLMAVVPAAADLSIADLVVDTVRRIRGNGGSGEVWVGVEWENGVQVERVINVRIGMGGIRLTGRIGFETPVGTELDEDSLADVVSTLCTPS